MKGILKIIKPPEISNVISKRQVFNFDLNKFTYSLNAFHKVETAKAKNLLQ